MNTIASQISPFQSVQDYLHEECNSEIRHEYIGGLVYAMGGASAPHNIIAGNLFASMHRHLAEGACRIFMSDMKLRLEIAGETIFYYPDIMVCCNPKDNERYYRSEPKLIVEVLSDTTARVDRREKLLAYQTIPSLEEYVLVEQDCQRITLHRRALRWNPAQFLAGNELHFASIGFSIAVNALYAGVDIEA